MPLRGAAPQAASQAAATPSVLEGRTAWRRAFVRLHRWFGLGAAAFLFIAGATGAIISWDHELDGWLNPRLYTARTQGEPRPALELARRVEAADPRVRVSYLPLAVEAGRTLLVWVEPRVDPRSGALFEPGYNQVALDPVTGETQGRRHWGKVSLARENLVPFLYRLHYSMHLPAAGGIEVGVLFMGVVAIAWVFDTLIALWLSFPNPTTWRRSLAFRWRAGGHRLVFDLHRSGGVWLFLLMLTIAITSVAMNLEREVMRPLVSLFSTLSPSPLGSRATARAGHPIEPRVGLAQALDLARAEARRRAWTQPAGGVSVSSRRGLYGIGFFEPGNSHGNGGLGNAWLYVDAQTGALAGAVVPGTGSAGDIFMQAMFPLHSGRIAGTAGRVLMSLLGVAVAVLSATGVLIWARKRRARARVSGHVWQGPPAVSASVARLTRSSPTRSVV